LTLRGIGSIVTVVMKWPLLSLAVALAACGSAEAEMATAPAPALPLRDPPRTVFTTNQFEVGETYTLGSVAVPENVPRPVVITDIDVLAWTNIEIVGRGVHEPDDEGIGLAPSWPPDVRSGRLDLRAIEQGTEWVGHVSPILGIRTTAPKSGLRGVVVSWIDGNGNPGSEIFDFAVQTCAPGACERDPGEGDWLLKELGLFTP
jgi:hypothetical protein